MGQCRVCNSHARNPGHHGRQEDVDRAEAYKRLLAEVITCLPGYSGCGDISREQRVKASCTTLLVDDMPLTLHEKIQRGIPPGFTSQSDWNRAQAGDGREGEI